MGHRWGRRRAAGFTLIELLVVVALIAILAVLAMPGMSDARDERITFDYARQVSSLLHRGKARASGYGAAHLVTIDAGAGRGRFLLFEALDGIAPSATPPYGPNPVGACNGKGQWLPVSSYVPGTIDNTARIIDGFTLDAASGVNVNANITATWTVGGAAAGAVAICFAPSGRVFVGTGATIGAATAALATAAPFADIVQVTVQRHEGAVVAGLTRNVILPGSASPRIQSL